MFFIDLKLGRHVTFFLQNVREKQPNPVMATTFRCINILGVILEILDDYDLL